MFTRKRNHIQTHIDTHEGEHITVYAGSPLNSTPPVNDKLYGLTIYGNSTQDGTPTPENPIEIKSVPSTFNLLVCGSNLFNKLNNYRQNVSEFTDFGEHIRITGNNSGITNVSNWNNGWYTPNGNLSSSEFNQPKLKYGDVITVSVDIRLVELGKRAQSVINLYSKNRNDGQIGSSKGLVLNEWVRVSQTFAITSADLIDKDDYYPVITLGSNTLDIKNIAIKYGTDSIYTPFKGVTTPITIKDTDNNSYELCSLPNGIKDYVDLESGKIIKRVREKRFSYPQEISLTTYTNKWKIASSSLSSGFIEIMHDDTEDVWGFTDSAPLMYGMCNLFKFERGTASVNMITTAAKANTYTRLRIWLSVEELGVERTTPIAEVSEAFSVWFNNLLQTKGDLIYLLETSTAQPYPLHPDTIQALKSIKSIQNYTQIYTSAQVSPTLKCGIRKLGNRALIDFNLTDENGNYLVDENGNKLGGLY